MAALLTTHFAGNRRTCRVNRTNDNVALSFLFDIPRKWPENSSKNPNIDPGRILLGLRGCSFGCYSVRVTLECIATVVSPRAIATNLRLTSLNKDIGKGP